MRIFNCVHGSCRTLYKCGPFHHNSHDLPLYNLFFLYAKTEDRLPQWSLILQPFLHTPTTLANLPAVEFISNSTKEFVQGGCLLAGQEQLLGITSGQEEWTRISHVRVIPQAQRDGSVAADDEFFVKLPVVGWDCDAMIREDL